MTLRCGKPILGRYLWLAGADVIAKATGFAITLLVLRHYGSAGLGATTFAASFTGYFLMLGTCGLDLLAVRTVARDASLVGAMASTMVILRLSLCVLVYAVLLACALWVPALRTVWGLIALFGLSLFTGSVSLSWIAEGLQKTNILALANLATQGLTLALLLAGVRKIGSLWVVPGAQVAAESLVALALWLAMKRILGGFRAILPWPECRKLLIQAAPICGARFMRALALGSDLVILGFFLSMRELGWYGGAYKLYILCVSLTALYFVIFLPRMTERWGESSRSFHGELSASLKRTLLLTLPVAVVAAVGARLLLQALYDPTFAIAAGPLQVLFLTVVVYVWGSHFRSALIAQGRQQADFKLVALASGVHVVAKLALVPAAGLLGAALGSLLGELSLLVLSWRAVCRDEALTLPMGGPPATVQAQGDDAHAVRGPARLRKTVTRIPLASP